MICPNCGTEAQGNFCAHCGARLVPSASPAPPPVPPVSPPPFAAEAPAPGAPGARWRRRNGCRRGLRAPVFFSLAEKAPVQTGVKTLVF